MRHREQEDLRRQPDGFKPNYMENVSTDGAHTSTCLVTFYTDVRLHSHLKLIASASNVT